MMRSASAESWMAASLPWRPSGPMFISYEDGTTPIPIRVLTTGAPMSLASSMTSAEAFIAPPPTRIRGRWLSRIHWTASCMPERSSVRGLTPYSSCRSAGSRSLPIWSTGRSMWTGPLLPIWHMSHASLIAWGSLSTSRTLKLCLVMGISRL